jgi:hypothetical protein
VKKVAFIFGILLIFVLCSCQYRWPHNMHPGLSGNNGAPGSPGDSISVIAASPVQCSNGGFVYTIFIDSNGNSILDSGEMVIGTPKVICNGTNGNDGSTGPQGPKGDQGIGSGISVTSSSSCPNGGIDITTFIDIFNTGTYQTGDTVTSLSSVCNGINGLNGSNGTNGTNGQNGNSYTITQTSATVLQCPTGGVVYQTTGYDGLGNLIAQSSPSPICNGATGANGAAAPFSPVSPITPCGANSSPWKEVLLCLSNGSVLSDFSETMSGQDTRLSFIAAGSYIDTDESGCNFSVSVDNSNNTTVSWSSGHNSYSTWSSGSVICQAH